jgi:sugar phosphate isomerase/epimerase
MWPDKSLPELAAFVKELGVDGIELPVRPNYPVTPDNIASALPEAVRIFREEGLKIGSVASVPNEETIATCGEAGVPIVRDGVFIPEGANYLETITDAQRVWDGLLPALEQHRVVLGIQNHCDRFLTHAMHLHHALANYDPKVVGAVFDPAHQALQGADLDMALDVAWPHIVMINLKNAFWKRMNGPEAEWAEWRPYWTTARHGLASWPALARELKRRGYQGDLCFSAEYMDEESTDRLIREDIAAARQLF